jgi:hypothetical protein
VSATAPSCRSRRSSRSKNTLITGGSTSGGAFFQIDYQNDLYVPYIQPTLTVRDLVLNLRTDADVISFPRAVTHANAAVEVAEATTAADPAISGATPARTSSRPASGQAGRVVHVGARDHDRRPDRRGCADLEADADERLDARGHREPAARLRPGAAAEHAR